MADMTDTTESLRAVFEGCLTGSPNADGSPSWCLECHQTLDPGLAHKQGCLVGAGLIALARLEAAERWQKGAIALEPRLEFLDLGAEITQDDMAALAADSVALARSPEEVT